MSQRSDSTIERSISHDQALFICVCARAYGHRLESSCCSGGICFSCLMYNNSSSNNSSTTAADRGITLPHLRLRLILLALVGNGARDIIAWECDARERDSHSRAEALQRHRRSREEAHIADDQGVAIKDRRHSLLARRQRAHALARVGLTLHPLALELQARCVGQRSDAVILRPTDCSVRMKATNLAPISHHSSSSSEQRDVRDRSPIRHRTRRRSRAS